MTLKGGAADKKGNRYENHWVVLKMAEVLAGRVHYLRIEPPYEDGVDFELQTQKETQYFQVKKPLTGIFNYSLRRLANEQILVRFKKKLEHTATKCVLASGTDSELRSLIESANDSTSFEEFTSLFLQEKQSGKQKPLYQKFEFLVGVWQCEESTAFDYLKRMQIEVRTEEELRTTTESFLLFLVESNPSAAYDSLSSFAWENIHHKILAHDIRAHLRAIEMELRQYSDDPRVHRGVEDANNRYVSQRPCDGAIGRIIRDDAERICALISGSDKSHGVMITGEAGVGKSCITVQVIEQLQKKNWPVLAFRIDNKEPTELPEQLGEQLGLPESPAIVLANIAQGRDCVLIIDQLDAVSEFSGRHHEFFWCIKAIIEQARDLGVHVLLACREADLRYDQRLRELNEHALVSTAKVEPLEQDTVLDILLRLGFVQVPTVAQMEVLRFPLHLHLLAETTQGVWSDNKLVLDFEGVNGLYGRFWDYKRGVISRRLPHVDEAQWSVALGALCKHMSHNQVLFAPKKILDGYSALLVKALQSERVLVFDGLRYSFFHQGFFDYVFARLFPDDTDLVTFLGDRKEQHLFRRAQIQQLLQYERDTYLAYPESSSYVERLRSLLVSPVVRPHLKQVVFAQLSDVKTPTPEEWKIIQPFAKQKQPSIWMFLFNKLPWFDFLYEQGVFQQYLAEGASWLIERIIILFQPLQQQRADEIAELLEPYVSVGGEWPTRLRYVMEYADVGVGRRLFSLFLRSIDEGVLDDPERSRVADFFWRKIDGVQEREPDWACEGIGHYLKRCLALSLTRRAKNPFANDTGQQSILQEPSAPLSCATSSPANFVKAVLPYLRQLIEEAAIRNGDPPWSDEIWGFCLASGRDGIAGVLLSSVEAALSSMAKSEPPLIRNLSKSRNFLDFETLLFLLIRSYTSNGRVFANDAIDMLCDEPSRLEAFPQSIIRKLLEAATPCCTRERLSRLEHILLNYCPTWEAEQESGQRGQAQYVLLGGIHALRRTHAVRRRLEKLKLKFSDDFLRTEPLHATGGLVESPVSETEACVMTDRQWIDAMKKHDRNDTPLGTTAAPTAVPCNCQASCRVRFKTTLRALRRLH